MKLPSALDHPTVVFGEYWRCALPLANGRTSHSQALSRKQMYTFSLLIGLLETGALLCSEAGNTECQLAGFSASIDLFFLKTPMEPANN
jgi:hypothetical protein